MTIHFKIAHTERPRAVFRGISPLFKAVLIANAVFVLLLPKPHPQWLEHANERFLLTLGSVVANTDYAVIHYTDPWHPKFFGRRDALVHAIRRQNPNIRQYADPLASIIACAHDTWNVAERDPMALQIRKDCAAFRQWFAAQSAPDLLQRFLTAFKAMNQSETFYELELDETFLEDLGCLATFDETACAIVWSASEDLGKQLAQAHPASLCEAIEYLRALTPLSAPWPPRTDYAQLLDYLTAYPLAPG